MVLLAGNAGGGEAAPGNDEDDDVPEIGENFEDVSKSDT